MEMNENYFSTNLRILLDKKDLNAQKLAGKLGVDTLTVNKWLNGATLPSEKELKKVCLVLNIAEEELVQKDLSIDNNKVVAVKKVQRTFTSVDLLIFGCVWLLAAVMFCIFQFALSKPNAYLCFIFAIPVTTLIQGLKLIVLKTNLANIKVLCLFSATIWFLALSLFLTFIENPNMWIVFVIALPVNAIFVALAKILANKKG